MKAALILFTCSAILSVVVVVPPIGILPLLLLLFAGIVLLWKGIS